MLARYFEGPVPSLPHCRAAAIISRAVKFIGWGGLQTIEPVRPMQVRAVSERFALDAFAWNVCSRNSILSRSVGKCAHNRVGDMLGL